MLDHIFSSTVSGPSSWSSGGRGASVGIGHPGAATDSAASAGAGGWAVAGHALRNARGSQGWAREGPGSGLQNPTWHLAHYGKWWKHLSSMDFHGFPTFLFCWIARFIAIFFPTSLWRVLVFGCALPPRLPPRSSPTPARQPHTTYSHTTCQTPLVHTQLTHTQLDHTQLDHTQLVQIQLVLTQLAHTQLVHIQLVPTQLVTTQLAHTQLVTTQLVTTTYSHTTCPHTTCSHTQLVHTQLVTRQLTLTHTQLVHTQLVLTQVVTTQLAHTQLVTFTLRGRRGAWRHQPALCVAGVALGDICLLFAWQAWHLVTWTCTLRGRRGTYGTGLALVARGTYGTGLALVARLVPSWRRCRRGCWHGRRGTWRHGLSVCVAGVALGDMDRHFAWQALSPRLLAWQAWQAWHLATWTVSLRGRRGTWRHWSSLCVAGVKLMALGWFWLRAWFPFDAVVVAAVGVAGVALGDMDRLFVWQAWHLSTWIVALRGRHGTDGTGLSLVAHLVPSWRCCRRGCWRVRRGSWRRGRALCVAGVALMALGWLWWRAWFPVDAVVAAAVGVACVALGDINFDFAWQAWHLATSTFTLRGRRGTWRHQLSLCVAGVARGDIDLHFARQAWHLRYWTGSGGALGSCLTPLLPLLLAWQAWHLATSTSTLRGRRGTWRHRPAFCVAAVVLGDIDLHFAWQVWCLWH